MSIDPQDLADCGRMLMATVDVGGDEDTAQARLVLALKMLHAAAEEMPGPRTWENALEDAYPRLKIRRLLQPPPRRTP